MARGWLEEEIAKLDPVEDSARVMLLSTNRMLPRYGGAIVLNLLYSLGFMRIGGQLEGALATDRGGTGKIHRQADKRADDTAAYFATWIYRGPSSEEGRASLRRVKKMHDHYAREYSISNETMVHTIALFTVQFEQLLSLIEVSGFSQIEQEAQLAHWRAIGEQLGAHEMPETWDGMERFIEWYEGSEAWFGPSTEGRRCGEALIRQFSKRWLPVGLRWAGRPLLLSLVEDHVVEVLGQRKPTPPVVWLVRRLMRAIVQVNQRFPRKRGSLVDPTRLLKGNSR